MKLSTYKLINKLRKEKNMELADAVLDLANSIDNWERQVTAYARNNKPDHDCRSGPDDGCQFCAMYDEETGLPDLSDYYYEQWKDAQVEQMLESEGQ